MKFIKIQINGKSSQLKIDNLIIIKFKNQITPIQNK